jgi:hypothetical protein
MVLVALTIWLLVAVEVVVLPVAAVGLVALEQALLSLSLPVPRIQSLLVLVALVALEFHVQIL